MTDATTTNQPIINESSEMVDANEADIAKANEADIAKVDDRIVAAGRGIPFASWLPIRRSEGVQILVELYINPLSPYWPLKDNRRCQLDYSCTNITKLSPSISGVSAVVVRPGPKFDPDYLYKVTLYNLENYTGWLLPLTLGVYPDLHHDGPFGDTTVSVLIERGYIYNYNRESIPEDADGFYDISPYYTRSRAL